MRLSILRAGGHFGKLGYVRGEYKFSLAPNEQKVWKDYHLVLINCFKRTIGDNWLLFTPPAVIAYVIYDWSKKANWEFNRKNPKDYENEV